MYVFKRFLGTHFQEKILLFQVNKDNFFRSYILWLEVKLNF